MAGTVKSFDSLVWIKRALLLIIVGLVVQLLCLFHVTPGRFMIFAAAGVGPVGLGLVLFAYAAIRARGQQSAGAGSEDEGAT